MVGFDAVVLVLVADMSGRRHELLEHPRVDRRPVGDHLDRRRPETQRPGEELPRSRGVSAGRDKHVNHLAVLIDGPVEIGPAAGDLDVGLVDIPPIARGVPGRRRWTPG
jgi:hypothetical protein